MGTCALAPVSAERLLSLLIIKLEPLTSVHTSRSAVLCRERWPGRWLACPVGLLGGRCDCWTGRRVLSPPVPTVVEWRHYRGADDAVMCTSFHTCYTTCRSAPSSPTLTAAEWMFPWQICFTGGGYSVSVSEQAKSIGIGSIGKLWYRSHPTQHVHWLHSVLYRQCMLDCRNHRENGCDIDAWWSSFRLLPFTAS